MLLKVQERFDADKSEICVAVAISKNSKSMVNEVMDWMNFKGTDDVNQTLHPAILNPYSRQVN